MTEGRWPSPMLSSMRKEKESKLQGRVEHLPTARLTWTVR